MSNLQGFSDVTSLQGRLIENLTIQTGLLKLGIGVPQFIKDNEKKLEKDLEKAKSSDQNLG